MKKKSGFSVVPFRWTLLYIYMAIGAFFALLAIGLLLGSVKHPKPEWGEFWMIRPLLVVPISGAAGGVLFYVIRRLLNLGTVSKIIGVFLGAFVYIISLWLGTVMGLDGTLWD